MGYIKTCNNMDCPNWFKQPFEKTHDHRIGDCRSSSVEIYYDGEKQCFYCETFLIWREKEADRKK